MPIKITMPALSPTMTEGNLAKWLKKEGDTVKAGDVIAEIETDKATMEVEAVDEGILAKILVPAGTPGVPVNDVIALLAEEGENLSNIVIPSAGEGSGKSKAQAKPDSSSAAPPQNDSNNKPSSAPSPSERGKQGTALQSEGVRSENKGDRIFASPLAKRIAKDKGVNLSAVKGSGPHGRIVRADLEGHAIAPPLIPPQAGGKTLRQQSQGGSIDAKKQADLLGMKYTEIPNNNIRRIVASRLLESKQTVPHFYLTVDCILDKLLEARADLNEKAAGVYKLSVNDFIIKAAAMALKKYPAANTAWTDAAILQYEHADISVAVATPNGLITPIIKQAENKGLAQISNEMKDLAVRAREGKLKPEEFQGGTFSISNLGMYGIKDFGAIINPPQACILAVGAGVQQPVVEKGQIVVRTVMSVTLSVDHRAVDGAVGAEYLQIFKQYIENPVSILV